MKDGRKCLKSPWRVIFISHMVQMKEAPQKRPTTVKDAFISHMVQMKVRLDETTIRNEIALYIPHGSDERLV